MTDSDRGYCHENGVQLDYTDYQGQNWMQNIGDGTTLARMSMPGTHDTMTLGGSSYGPSVQTQTMTLIEQLYSGIRVIDIRLVHNNNAFDIYHGSVFLHTNFDDVLTIVSSFLAANPTETVLMRARQESSTTGDYQGSGNTRSFDDTFTAYQNQYSPLLWTYTGNNPTLGSVRGQLVVLQDFDGSW